MKTPDRFFTKSNSDLIPNVDPKEKPVRPTPNDFEDSELDDFNDSCPNCNSSLSEHTKDKKIQCALSRIRGI